MPSRVDGRGLLGLPSRLGQPADRLQLQAETEQGLQHLGQQPGRQLVAALNRR